MKAWQHLSPTFLRIYNKSSLMLKSALCCVLLCFTTTVHSQSMQRYRSNVFTDVTVEKNLSYHPGLVEYEKAYQFDLYQPQGDTATKRRLIIWLHGGGFKYGSKTDHSMRFWNKLYAQKGYVCVSINYRLSKYNPVSHFDELLTSCFYAVQDARTAIAYFRQNAAHYNIDPDKIIIGGISAGAITALQAVYSTNEQLGEIAHIPEAQIKKALPYQPVSAVISYWGAIFNLEWLGNNNVPIVCVHGTKDRIVQATGKSSFYGSIPIHAEADKRHIPNTLKLYEGYGHELQRHFNPLFAGPGTHKRWRDAGQFTTDFLYDIIGQ